MLVSAVVDVLIGEHFKNEAAQKLHYFLQWHTVWSTAEDATGYIHD